MDGQTANKRGLNANIEYGRLLTELFIGGLDDEGMTNEILWEVAMLEDIEEATSEHVLT